VTSRAKLTVYFGEHDGIDGELLGAFARHRVEASVLLRGSEGFGIKHHLHSERLLTLSEDLPLVAIAVDSRERILDHVLPEVSELAGDGLVTIENARSDRPPPDSRDVKLTVLCGRAERVGGGPAFVAVVDLLHRHGVEGATVLLGLDGTVHGERRRARFFAGNADVPLVVVAVGDATRVGSAATELDCLLERPLMTFEGVTMGPPPARVGPASESAWQKLTIYSSERAKLGGRPLHIELVRRLRAAGAEGATCLRGIWGYHGDLPPHGDRLLSLRRRVPVVTTVVCEAPNAERWFGIVSEAADAGGLVTTEGVPAARAAGPGVSRGTLQFP
jgi:PII-like signaling protein